MNEFNIKNFVEQQLKQRKIDALPSFLKRNFPNEYQKIIDITSYLPINCKFTERLYNIVHNLNYKK